MRTGTRHGGRSRRGRQRPRRAAERPAERLRLTGWRRVAVPLTVAVGIPLLLFAALEVGLRVAGAGYDPHFLRPVAGHAGHSTTNFRFGWRFFPRRMARRPRPVDLPAAAGDDAVRIFVLGGSAAMGTPEPAFSFGRVLETMLAARHPGSRFRVVNAAMVAINSHVVLPIAREIAARHHPDLMVVYVGNNEVVGPYGPGTVFAGFSRSLPLIRTGVALRTLRTGQLLAALGDRLRGGPGVRGDWRGMEMFVERPVPMDDPRLPGVADHFRRNLEGIADAAAGAGAGLVLSTVAVNLADSPPFGSAHRPGLPAARRSEWERRTAEGIAAAAAGRAAAAERAFAAAAAIDDRYAELRYRRGRALLALGKGAAGRAELAAARDLDTLRFRTDGRLEEVIRRVAAERTAAGAPVALVEAAAALEAAAFEGAAPAPPLFHEHVHLTFHGNWLLAREMLPAAERLLAGRIGAPAAALPDEAACAARLAYDAGARAEIAAAMLHLTSRPPFTRQLDHARRRAARRERLAELRRAALAARDRDLEALRAAAAAHPDDLELGERLARRLGERGAPGAAAAAWRRLLDRLPDQGPWRSSLGFALADAGDLDGAERELRRVVELEPRAAAPRANLGTLRARRGDAAGARRLYAEALRREPDDVPTLLDLARLEEADDFAAAVATYRRAVAASPEPAEAEDRLAEAWDRHGDLDAAVAAYRRAVATDPSRARTWNNLGYALERQGDLDGAIDAYRRSLHADLGYALPWFNLADALLRQGRADEAVACYRAGLALAPDNPAARHNLAIAEGRAQPPG